MAVDIIYETHSTTEDNERGIATGWLPGRLSEQGRREAVALGERRRGTGLAAVFTSDLARAVETTEIAFAGSGLPVHLDARLRECNYGELNGAPAEMLRPRSRHIDDPFPGGQSYREVVDATRGFLRDLASRWDGTTVLVVAHSANRWALDCLLAGRAVEDLVDAPFEWQPGWHHTLPVPFHG
ncbi:hypothetical protein N865_04050 [Intrasporangium oryzae NRRL B-24470]|uniref:Phosphoglycerate mutase n=1 Tax=Intrasporangium oryzae NRRL B-24470 TaxID=1386089 RepID=W9GGV7_9MICO|nr:histidine phosphatase family protein [Intrasporangium oryzae]EWT03094.1 hypothetical protein N865_04050 [Intrasporangium oryzae NRRL B-24470]